MATVDYMIRDIDKKLWAKVKARAESEGHSLVWLLKTWIANYANGKDQTS